jgi:GDP-L-fucose synthase
MQKVFIAGHRGMVGSAVWRLFEKNNFELIGKTSTELDLRNQNDVNDFYNEYKPDIVIDLAARVGGILANNNYPYQFLMENMQIQNNLIDGAHKFSVKKFIFLGSSCIYPKFAQQPIDESSLLTGSLEPTNEWYAIAKIAGVKSCEAIRKQYGKYFISLMPTNLYGPNDNFDLETSHVLPAIIRKFHDAKNNNAYVNLWGTGYALREFLHVDDLAKAILFSIQNELNETLYNVGSNKEISIKNLAELIKETITFEGKINWDSTKPDGTPRKLMNTDKLNNLGWHSEIDLNEGIKRTYNWFLENINNFKQVKLQA